jgi:DNA polymerase III sliding clamp (beta) subunit (PCNA family)
MVQVSIREGPLETVSSLQTQKGPSYSQTPGAGKNRLEFRFPRDLMITALTDVLAAQSASDSAWAEVRLCEGDLIILSSLAKNFFIQSRFHSPHDQQGSFKIPGKSLLEYMKQLPPVEIQMVAEAEKVTVRSGRSFARFQLVFDSLSTEFEIPQIGAQISIEAQALKEWAASFSDFISVEDMRFFSNGALVWMENVQGVDSLFAVASDSVRLAKTRCFSGIQVLDADQSSVLVPKAGMDEVLRYASSQPPNKRLNVRWQQSTLFFALETAEYKMFIKGIAGKYPNYLAAVPKNATFIKSVKRAELLESAKRVLFFCDKSKHISMKFDGDLVAIDSYGPFGGQRSGQEFVGVLNPTDQLFQVDYNGQNLVNVLSKLNGEVVTFEWENADRPVKIVGEPTAGRDSFYLLVPIRNL